MTTLPSAVVISGVTPLFRSDVSSELVGMSALSFCGFA